MPKDYQSDDDELGQFPSAASPLSAMGIDPDEARANPEFMARLTRGPAPAQQTPAAGPAGRIPTDAARTRSAVAAGQVGGAGAPDPTNTGNAALTQTLGEAAKTANAIPTSNPEVDALSAKQKELSQKEPLYDKDTGKMLAGDKPSTGQRIWRGVRSGIVGLAIGGIPGAIVGAVEPGDVRGGQAYGAPNTAYQRREQTREQNLGSTTTSLETARANWKSALDATKDKGTLLKDTAVAANDLVKGGTASTRADIEKFKAEATAENYKNKADETDKKLQEQMRKDLQTAQTNEERLSILRDNAAMHDEIQRSQLEFAKQKVATLTDAKTVDQWQKEQIDSVNKDYTGILNSAWNRITAGSKQDRIAEINRTADGRRAALGLGTGTSGGAPAPAPTPAAAPPPQKGFTRIKASDGFMHDIPSANLAKARARDPKLTVMGQ